MRWHDCHVWAPVADTEAFELSFDLDYILQWVNPGPGETYFNCWVSPATMAFENARDVRIDIESQQGFVEIERLDRKAERLTRSCARSHSRQPHSMADGPRMRPRVVRVL